MQHKRRKNACGIETVQQGGDAPVWGCARFRCHVSFRRHERLQRRVQHRCLAFAAFIAVSVLAAAFCGTISTPLAHASEEGWFAGSNRYETSELVAQAASDQVGGASGAIIVNGEDFPDALVASSYAGISRYPILLTEPGELPTETKTELEQLKSSASGNFEIVVIGGENAVSSAVMSELEGYSTTEVKRCFGTDRIATAEAVYREWAASGTWGSTAIICSSRNFADATSISPYAYAHHAPIFLVDDSGNLTDSTKACLESAKAAGMTSVVICGGDNAVSADCDAWCQDQLDLTPVRLAGADRYDTNRLVCAWCVGQGMSYAHLAFASGANFPDALAGSALQGASNSVLVLVADGTGGKQSMRSVIDANALSSWCVFGGTGAVSYVVRFEVQAAADGAYKGVAAAGVAAARYCLDHVGDYYSQDNRWADGVYDCSSLAYRCYSEPGIYDIDAATGTSGYDVPGDICYSAANEAWWCVDSGKTVSPAMIRAGDWIFYGSGDSDTNGRYLGIYHVAICVGDGHVVEAVGDAEGVCLDGLRGSTVGIYGRAYK